MPIKIQSDLPVKELLEQENIFVMDDTRAMHQDIFEPAVQIVGVHTLFHRLTSIPVGVSALYTLRRDFVNMRCRGGFVRLWRKNGVLRQFSLPPRCCRAKKSVIGYIRNSMTGGHIAVGAILR